ncbi:Coilin [Artemisia annua]|uniref:Coilin n=1 Tax=Artemisia annua TaxID=35608 RepID=A0A2U1M2B4_ARTAN|nr:Coilin [Artemisia annua]
MASKVNRKKKHRSEVLSGAEDEVLEDEMDHAFNGKSLHKKIVSKKKSKRNEEINKENAETLDKNVKDNVKGVEQASTTPDEAKKGPSRSARRKKAKRQRRRELANVSQNVDGKEAASSLISSSNNKSNLSKEPSPVGTNKGANTWNELAEMAKVINAYKVGFVFNISDPGEDDSLSQNGLKWVRLGADGGLSWAEEDELAELRAEMESNNDL